MIEYNTYTVVSNNKEYIVTRVSGTQPDVEVGERVELAFSHEDVNHPDFRLHEGIVVDEIISLKTVYG